MATDYETNPAYGNRQDKLTNKSERSQPVLDYLYDFLASKFPQKGDRDNDLLNNENFYSKFHNLFYLVDSLVLNESHRHHIPWSKGISVDICDFYLQRRENSEKDSAIYGRFESKDNKLKKIIKEIYDDNTAAYVIALHTLKAEKCEFKNEEELYQKIKSLRVAKWGDTFEGKDIKVICDRLLSFHKIN